MKLFCVGCGPGDPELLTVKAVNTVKNAEIIFAPTAREGKPSIALSVVERYVDKFAKKVDLVFPMVKDRESLKDYWKRNADKIADAVRTEKRVIYLTVGDPALYSTWIYIHRELQKNHSDIEIDIVPGIASMFAFAACYDLDRVKQTANSCDTVIFLKDGRYFDSVIEMLADVGFADDSMIGIAQDVSVTGEIMKMSKLRDLRGIKGNTEKYFSIMVAKKKNG